MKQIGRFLHIIYVSVMIISLQRNLADPAVIRAKEFLEGAPVDGATFKDLSILRKEINDSLFFRGEISTQGSIVLKETLEVLNDMLDTKVIASAINPNPNNIDWGIVKFFIIISLSKNVYGRKT